ncbi:SANT domain-containing protein [Heracleum sosnowskyi]|uniref:SANT domain-containing protein n=1 Tax=Heracleum sosnowskyi TaxID=360622 RepID=A0AAD8IC31_9APIA|nr:SANT domain-containing protein [Heracleum sosnowskyi]
MINPWTSEEKDIFLDKLSIFGKDFRKISSFLDNKTTADCVEFYYKNHKSDCFQKAKKKPEFAEKGKSYSKSTYLVTSGKRWNRDNNAASLDLLGAASAIAANDDDGLENQKCAPRLIFGSCNSRTARGDDVMPKRSSAINILGSERENVAADVLAGICGSLSSEAMSSCITSSIDIGEGYQERKCQPMRLKKRRSVTPEVAQDVDEDTCSDESCGEVDQADWTDEERSVFIQAVSSYGKDFAMISRCVRTKSSNQCKVFFSKARKCLGLDMMHRGSCSGGASLSDNGDGDGGADMEDASLVENGSGVKSGCKTDDDLSLSSSKAVQTETSPLGTINIHPDVGKSNKINNAGELDVIADEPDDDVSAGSKYNSDGSESLAVKILENGFGTRFKRQNEAAESGGWEKPEVVQEVSDIVKPSCTEVQSGINVDSSRAEEAGTEFSLLRNSFNGKDLEAIPPSDGNVTVSDGTDLSATGTLPGREHINPVNLVTAPFSVLQTPVIQDPDVLQTEKSLKLTSNLLSGNSSNTHLNISVSAEDGYNKPPCQQSSRDHISPLNSLQAYPPSIPTKKALNGDIGNYKPTPSQSISKVDEKSYSDHLLHQDTYLPKSNGHGPKHNDMRSELHLLSQDHLKENSRRPRPRCLSDSDQPTRKGDVKLFGQILSHPSAQQKPNSRAEEKEDREAKHAKSSENSYNLKITPSPNLDGILASTKFDHNSYLGLRDMGLPVRSFGFWDGNRIQTGFPSLPDSAILLARYPAAFVMPARELGSSKGVADYQAYMNCDGAKVQPFAVDLKQQQNRFYSEMQRQRRGSEFDGVSSVQQQRGMVGLDVLGRGGILNGGGGPRNTVSDPVAAIRRHYAGEQYNGQIGSIIREEAWRSNGNVGR